MACLLVDGMGERFVNKNGYIVKKKPLDYIRTFYAVPAVIGGRVKIDGRLGTITDDRGHYLGVTFDDDQDKIPRNCHPAWNIEYLPMPMEDSKEIVKE
jgi:hypothetical protein